ncbi:MAG: PEP-CTERM sorting domain-containing protein [Deltaproteobacteria bacterium]|nr:PEP-CTERM sorting domain-containing protein [Deltaproteobacteria bacterium]
MLVQTKFLAFALATMFCFIFVAAASQAAQVSYNRRHFEADGSGGDPPSVTPCCASHPITPNAPTIVPGTFDTRTTGVSTTPTAGQGTTFVVAGRPYLAEQRPPPDGPVPWYGNVNTANGALTLAPGGYRVQESLMVTAMFLPPGFLFQTISQDFDYATGVFAAGAGPGGPATAPIQYDPDNNPIFVTNMNTNTFMSTPSGPVTNTTTTTTTAQRDLAGQYTFTQGPQKFGGTQAILGFQNAFLGLIGVGTASFLSFPIPRGPGIPFGTTLGAARSTKTAMVQVHSQTISGPTIANVTTNQAIMTFFPWTTGMITGLNTTFGTIASNFTTGAGHPFRTGPKGRIETGFDNRNAAHTTGTLQLVGARMLQTNNSVVIWTRVQHLDFVPEPGSLALIGAGLLGCIGLSVHRRRNH